MQPYTYCITHIPTGKRYYGARWSKDCSPDDLWVTYFTSSKHIKEIIKRDGVESFLYEVRKVFSDVDSCRTWENRVLTKLKVTTNDKWLNKNINGKFLSYGKQSPEHIANRVNSLIKNGRRKGVVSWTPESHPDVIEKLKKAHTGIKKSPQHVESMKLRPQDTMITTCEHCGKTGDYKNMKRWHHDRCKNNCNRITDKDPNKVTCSKCGYSTLQSANFYRYHNENCKLIP